VPRLPYLILLALVLALPAPAQKRYDPGASDTEIKVGNFVPYTGPFAEYGAIGRAEAAYFRMVNDHGGIRGRKVTFISLDSGPGPEAALALTRRLVEEDQVLLVAGAWGSPSNKAIRPYLNERRVPQLFVAGTDATFEDPEQFPWTMGFAPSKRTEASRYGQYLLEHKPDARIAVLTSDDEEGAEYRAGLAEGLGAKAAAMIVQDGRFRYSDPDAIEAAVAKFQKAGADVFMNLAIGRFATRGIRAAYDLGWRPLQFIPNASLSVTAFLEPAGLPKAYGLICNARSKGWLGPARRGPGVRRDPAVEAFLVWMRTYNPEASLQDAQNVFGYEVAQTLEAVLKACGDDLTRANVLAQATHLDLELGMLAPGIRVRTSPTDYRPIKDLYFVRFDGKEWVHLGADPAP
jgi:branched-chain amino acid transport system substrate-binding protein